MRILLVEDDNSLGGAVREQVAADGHAVDWVQLLDEGRSSARGVPYDLVLLDLMLPDGRGLDFLRELRRGGSVAPVIILTARDQISDRIAGLNAGADDYLVKPFDLAKPRHRAIGETRKPRVTRANEPPNQSDNQINPDAVTGPRMHRQ